MEVIMILLMIYDDLMPSKYSLNQKWPRKAMTRIGQVNLGFNKRAQKNWL